MKRFLIGLLLGLSISLSPIVYGGEFGWSDTTIIKEIRDELIKVNAHLIRLENILNDNNAEKE